MTLITDKTTEESLFKHDFKRFPKFLEYFKTTDIWKAMEATVENSPWHREALSIMVY